MITKTFGVNGVHPNDYKSYTCRKPVEYIDVPDRVYIPIGQHIGKPAKIVVQIGDIIEEGQLIAEADGFVSANIHASIPGTVVGIESRYQTNGRKCDVVVIELNGRFSKTGSAVQLADWKSMSKKDILTKIQQAGIVGMGGAVNSMPSCSSRAIRRSITALLSLKLGMPYRSNPPAASFFSNTVT